MSKTLILIVLSATFLVGCGTVNGIGEDISGAARRVQGWF
jgi:predicted small secreted protein